MALSLTMIWKLFQYEICSFEAFFFFVLFGFIWSNNKLKEVGFFDGQRNTHRCKGWGEELGFKGMEEEKWRKGERRWRMVAFIISCKCKFNPNESNEQKQSKRIRGCTRARGNAATSGLFSHLAHIELQPLWVGHEAIISDASHHCSRRGLAHHFCSALCAMIAASTATDQKRKPEGRSYKESRVVKPMKTCWGTPALVAANQVSPQVWQ